MQIDSESTERVAMALDDAGLTFYRSVFHGVSFPIVPQSYRKHIMRLAWRNRAKLPPTVAVLAALNGGSD